MRKNKILMFVIVLLSTLVLVLGLYILYDRVLYKEDEVIDNNSVSSGNDNVILTNKEALVVVKELAKKFFEYKHSLGPYCGDTDYNDYISFGSYETMDFRDYWVSTTFKNISEIREYYESIMTKDLIPSYLDNGISYIEQDGKLYCQLSHKGPGETYNEEASYFTIHSIDSNIIKVNVILASDQVDYINRREGIIEIIKNTDGNWVISKYDVQISDLD